MNSGAPLSVFNTLTRTQETFQPLEDNQVRMYSCGPTVYAYAHLGNMRAYVFADTLKRALWWKGYEVRHIINITDVGHLTSDADEGEDKLEAAASREKRSIWDIADMYTEAFMDDITALNVVFPDRWTKATDYIAQMVAFAQRLEDNGFTYQLPSGLYFDTSKVANYGALARLDIEGLRAGARVEVVEGKKSITDFALWRATPPGESRQMEWDSPWGKGAPGWHLECSVMSIEQLGDHFDIHTGGIDHVPVHHTNEIAQSEAYLGDGKPWVPTWMHNEFINFGEAKMSKSKGDSLRVADFPTQGIHPLSYRFFLLMSHYRAQTVFNWNALHGANIALRRFVQKFEHTNPVAVKSFDDATNRVSSERARDYINTIDEAISDDLATPRVLATLSELARDTGLDAGDLDVLVGVLNALLGLEFGKLKGSDFSFASADAPSEEFVLSRIAEREAARVAKDYARSDELRDELLEMGIELRDTPNGTDWDYVWQA